MTLRRISGPSMAAFLALAFVCFPGSKARAQRIRETVSDDGSQGQEQPFQRRRVTSRDPSDDSGTEDSPGGGSGRPEPSERNNKTTYFGARLFGGWGFGLASELWTKRSGSGSPGDTGVFGNPGSGLLGGVEGLFGKQNSWELGLSAIPFTVRNYSFSETYTNAAGTNNRQVTDSFNSTAFYLSIYAQHSFGSLRLIGGWGFGYALGGDEVYFNNNNWTGNAVPGAYNSTLTRPLQGAFSTRGFLGLEYPLGDTLALMLGTSLVDASFSQSSGATNVTTFSGPAAPPATTSTVSPDSSKTTGIAVMQQSLLFGISLRL